MKWFKKVLKSKRFLSFFIPFFTMIACLIMFSYWNYKRGFEINLNAIAVCFAAASFQGYKYINAETERPSGHDKEGKELIEL